MGCDCVPYRTLWQGVTDDPNRMNTPIGTRRADYEQDRLPRQKQARRTGGQGPLVLWELSFLHSRYSGQDYRGAVLRGMGEKYGADGTDCPDLELKEPEGDLGPKEQI